MASHGTGPRRPEGPPDTSSGLYGWLDERLDLTAIRTLAAEKTVPVHKREFWYCLGGITLFLFVVQVATGILLMGLMLVKSFIPGNYSGGEEGVKATSLFWHFVDVIWIILFVLLYVWRA